MSDCLFCKIIAREIPSTPVYEDEAVYAFLDIHPVNPGHTLVVPKKHCTGFLDCDPSTLQKWIIATKKIAQAMKNGLGLEGLNLLQNEGEVAGQAIFHLHIHIIPRFAQDGLNPWRSKPYPSSAEAQAVAEKIKNSLVK